jgi:hypothetical protein
MAGINNYTGMLTRSIVFSGALVVFLAATAMTIAAIIIPNWISFDSETNHGTYLHYTYGLHRRCSNTDSPSYLSLSTNSLHCVGFPQHADCQGSDRYFCSMWRSVAFLMTFAVVIEGMTIVAFGVLISGGKQRREQGWGVMAILAGLAALIQSAAMALIVGSLSSVLLEYLLTRVLYRPTSSRTTIASSWAGTLIRVGSCALYPGAFKLFVPWPLQWRRLSCRAREATN